MPHVNKRPDKCREKTRRGNAFKDSRLAKRVASRLSRQLGRKINWFRCTVCGGYHVGKKGGK